MTKKIPTQTLIEVSYLHDLIAATTKQANDTTSKLEYWEELSVGELLGWLRDTIPDGTIIAVEETVKKWREEYNER